MGELCCGVEVDVKYVDRVVVFVCVGMVELFEIGIG